MASDVFKNFPDISFIDETEIDDVLDSMITAYQEKYYEVTGQSAALSQANPYRMIMYACAVQIYQTMQWLDRAGKQNFLKYSYGDFLDNLGTLRGVERLEASAAVTTVRFEIESALESAITIPQGTRVTNGNELYFATDEVTEIAIGDTYVDIPATCTETGTGGNGFSAGEINVLVETLAYITNVYNTTTTTGGSETEDDDTLAERIYLAGSSYSVAGPADAYVYWTKTVNSSIADVSVTSPNPCEVDVRFILDGGILPDDEMIEEVEEVLSDDNIRPLTDQVTVSAPDTISYDVEITYYINSSDKNNAVTIQENVETAVNNYVTWQQSSIGRDINPSYLINLVMSAGAKRIEVTSPVFTEVESTSLAYNGDISITYGGLEDD